MNDETTLVTRDPTIWEERAYALIRDEMKRRKMGFKQLSAKLTTLGVIESPAQVARKLTRKRFSAAFMLACLAALDVDAVVIGDKLNLVSRTAQTRASPPR